MKHIQLIVSSVITSLQLNSGNSDYQGKKEQQLPSGVPFLKWLGIQQAEQFNPMLCKTSCNNFLVAIHVIC